MPFHTLARKAWVPCALPGLGLGTAHAQSTPAAAWPAQPLKWVVPYAPGGTPDAVIQTLRKAMALTLKDPALRETMAKQNMGEGYLDQPEFKAVIERDNAVFKPLVDRLGIKA